MNESQELSTEKLIDDLSSFVSEFKLLCGYKWDARPLDAPRPRYENGERNSPERVAALERLREAVMWLKEDLRNVRLEMPPKRTPK